MDSSGVRESDLIVSPLHTILVFSQAKQADQRSGSSLAQGAEPLRAAFNQSPASVWAKDEAG